MPLVGLIDEERAELLTSTLLAAIERERARCVIMDVTGVPLVDTAVAGALLQAGAAARLLGAETVLVGIRPELAQTIVSLGVSLDDLVTRNNLEAGLRYAMEQARSAAA
jgi:rsbT co-antagonist protein RsbR